MSAATRLTGAVAMHLSDRQARVRRKCSCGAPAVANCSFLEGGRRCDVPMCASHDHVFAGGVHHCDGHWLRAMRIAKSRSAA